MADLLSVYSQVYLKRQQFLWINTDTFSASHHNQSSLPQTSQHLLLVVVTVLVTTTMMSRCPGQAFHVIATASGNPPSVQPRSSSPTRISHYEGMMGCNSCLLTPQSHPIPNSSLSCVQPESYEWSKVNVSHAGHGSNAPDLSGPCIPNGHRHIYSIFNPTGLKNLPHGYHFADSPATAWRNQSMTSAIQRGIDRTL